MVIKVRYWLLLVVGMLAFLLCHIYSTNGKGIRDMVSLGVLLFICVSSLYVLYHKRQNNLIVNAYRAELLFLFLIFVFCILYIGASIASVIFLSFFCLLLLGNLNITKKVYSVLCLSLIVEVSCYYLFYGVGEENGIAINLSCGLVALLCLILNQFELKRRSFFIITLVWMILGIWLLFSTQCRGGILAVFLVGIFTLLSYASQNRNIKKIIIKRVLILVLAIILIYYMLSIPEIEMLFFEKWDGGDDITSDRFFIWNKVFNTATLFGLGPDYYMKDADAHNSYIDFLGTFGWIPSLFALILVGLFYFRFHKRNPIPLPSKVFFVYWMVLSMTENLNPFTSRFLLVSLFLYINISNYLSSVKYSNIKNYAVKKKMNVSNQFNESISL